MSIQGTHWDDCWKSGPEHYECAVGEVKSLQAEKDAIKVAAWDKWADTLTQWNAAIQRAEKAEAEVERLRKGIAAVSALIADSSGVYGLHLNGDPAPWDELLSGGRFEEWLADFDAARGES